MVQGCGPSPEDNRNPSEAQILPNQFDSDCASPPSENQGFGVHFSFFAIQHRMQNCNGPPFSNSVTQLKPLRENLDGSEKMEEEAVAAAAAAAAASGVIEHNKKFVV